MPRKLQHKNHTIRRYFCVSYRIRSSASQLHLKGWLEVQSPKPISCERGQKRWTTVRSRSAMLCSATPWRDADLPAAAEGAEAPVVPWPEEELQRRVEECVSERLRQG